MSATAPRTHPRPLIATAIAALLLLVLSGCVKFNADFTVDAEETLSGTMRLLVDPVALEDMGSSDPSQELDDAVQEAQSDPSKPAGVTVERADDDDGYLGMEVVFDQVPAAELSSGAGLDDVGVEGIDIASADGEISFSMANPLVSGMDAAGPGMPTSARSMFDEAIVSVSFPGAVISAEGAAIDGSTATWDLREYDGDALTAVGKASGFPWMVVIIAGGVLLLLLIAGAVVVLLLVLRKRKSTQPTGFPMHQQMPAYPGGAAADPQGAPMRQQGQSYPAQHDPGQAHPGGPPQGMAPYGSGFAQPSVPPPAVRPQGQQAPQPHDPQGRRFAPPQQHPGAESGSGEDRIGPPPV